MLHYFIAGLLSLCAGANGYSSGAPSGQCDQMIPGHRVSPQSGTSPYNIIVSAEKYMCPNEEIKVTVNGTVPFKGFLCQARGNPDVYSTVGTITVSAGGMSTQNKCGTNAALTHTEGSDKSTMSLVWRSPATQNNVYMVCTIVQEKNTFWVKLQSSMISFQAGGNCGGSGTGSGSGSGSGTSTGSGSESGNGSDNEGKSASSKHKSSLTRMLGLFLVLYLNSRRS